MKKTVMTVLLALCVSATSAAAKGDGNNCSPNKGGPGFTCAPPGTETYTFGSASSESDASAKLDAYLANINGNSNENNNTAEGGDGGNGIGIGVGIGQGGDGGDGGAGGSASLDNAVSTVVNATVMNKLIDKGLVMGAPASGQCTTGFSLAVAGQGGAGYCWRDDAAQIGGLAIIAGEYVGPCLTTAILLQAKKLKNLEIAPGYCGK